MASFQEKPASSPLPTIDISTFINPFSSPEEKEKLAEKIKELCVEIGFFYVRVQNISNAELDRIISLVRAHSAQSLPAPTTPKIEASGEEILVRCGPHTDYGSVTLLFPDPSLGSLKLLTKKGQWVKADPIPGTFLVNVGNVVERRVNGLWRSAGCRVIHKGDEYQVSVPLFDEPSFSVVVKGWVKGLIAFIMGVLSKNKWKRRVPKA
jgi:isopenicillin N synthase-like dioxygenase